MIRKYARIIDAVQYTQPSENMRLLVERCTGLKAEFENTDRRKLLIYMPEGKPVEVPLGSYVYKARTNGIHIVDESLFKEMYVPIKQVIYEQIKESKDDSVNHPSHYTQGNIETIEYIEDKLTDEQLEGYFAGNIIKYISRYKYKNGIEDLKKARWYLDRMIKKLEEKRDNYGA